MRIQTKVFLTILLSSVLLVGVMVQLMQWSLDRELLNYVNQRQINDHQVIVEELKSRYVKDQWQSLSKDPLQFYRIVRQFWPRKDAKHRRDNDQLPGETFRKNPLRKNPLHDSDRDNVLEDGDADGVSQLRRAPQPPRGDQIARVDSNEQVIIGSRRHLVDSEPIPILLEGKLVGRLLLPRIKNITEVFDLQLRDQQQGGVRDYRIGRAHVSGRLCARVFTDHR